MEQITIKLVDVCAPQANTSRLLVYTPSRDSFDNMYVGKSDKSLLYDNPSSLVSHNFPSSASCATQMLLNLKTLLGRKVTLHALHFMLWNYIDWVHSGNAILLIKDLFAIHIWCHRP